MTIREAGKGAVTAGGGVYNIGFNGDDETQFTAFNMAELEQLWREFCKENSFAKNSVDYVERA